MIRKLLAVFLSLTLMSGCGQNAGTTADESSQTADTPAEAAASAPEGPFGKSVSSIDLIASEGAVDTQSRQFQAYKDYVTKTFSESEVFQDYEMVSVKTGETGIVIELADDKYSEGVTKGVQGAALEVPSVGELFNAWKTVLDSLTNLSQTVSDVGYDKFSKPCDCSILLLNYENKDLALAYAANGSLYYDVFEELSPKG